MGILPTLPTLPTTTSSPRDCWVLGVGNGRQQNYQQILLNTMKQKILDFIKSRPYTSYAELSKLEGFSGDYQDCLKPNLILWSGISEQAANALLELWKDNKIEVTACDYLVYLIDGMTLPFPIAKKVAAYKKPHWLPITFKAT